MKLANWKEVLVYIHNGDIIKNSMEDRKNLCERTSFEEGKHFFLVCLNLTSATSFRPLCSAYRASFKSSVSITASNAGCTFLKTAQAQHTILCVHVL